MGIVNQAPDVCTPLVLCRAYRTVCHSHVGVGVIVIEQMNGLRPTFMRAFVSLDVSDRLMVMALVAHAFAII